MARVSAPSRRFAAALARAALLATVVFSDAPGAEPHAEQAELAGLLQRLAKQAIVYRDNALNFACDETITWSEKGKGGSARFGYVFAFDEGYGFTDYRTPPRKGVRKKPLPQIEPEDFGVPAFLGSAYLWIFSFRAERQPRHVYRLAGMERIDGRPARMIRFEPVPPLVPGVNDWFGTAWVDEASAQLLKVEAYTPPSWARLQEVKETSAPGGADAKHHDVEQLTTFFTVERNGLRFPGRVRLRRDRYTRSGSGHGWKAVPVTLLEVNQVYRNYEFFGVRVEARQGETARP